MFCVYACMYICMYLTFLETPVKVVQEWEMFLYNYLYKNTNFLPQFDNRDPSTVYFDLLLTF